MSELALIRWDAPGPYAVAFSTRRGGVSGAPFDTLNLGRLTDDDPERVGENRRRLCAEVGTDAELLSLRAAGARRRRQAGGGAGEPGDGLWTDTPGQPLLVFTADCLPVAIVRSNGGPAAVGGAPRRLARPAGRDRRECRRGARRRHARGRDRPGDRSVLLRGRGRGRRSVPRAVRRGNRPGRTARPLDRRRACAGRGRHRQTCTGPTSARPATRTSSSRTGATPGVPAARG